MNDRNEFALVPKPPGSLEKAEPGAKRILSDMVADTLALAKPESPQKARPLRIIMVDDVDTTLQSLKLMMQYLLHEATILAFGSAHEGLREVEREAPDLFTTNWTHDGMPGPEILERLVAMKVRCPIFVISAAIEAIKATDFLREYKNQGLNITFLPKPFMSEQLRPLLLKHLGSGQVLKLREGAP